MLSNRAVKEAGLFKDVRVGWRAAQRKRGLVFRFSVYIGLTARLC